MHESRAQIDELQRLLDRSYEGAGPHLKRIFTPDSRLGAEELIEELAGIFEIHLGTTTPAGAPFVAPIDALLFRGEIWFGVPSQAVRLPFLRRDPRVSLSFTRGETFALIVHGEAIEVEEGSEDARAFQQYCEDEYVKRYGPEWLAWRDEQRNAAGGSGGYTAHVRAHHMFARR